jgi:hypothetical protein
MVIAMDGGVSVIGWSLESRVVSSETVTCAVPVV